MKRRAAVVIVCAAACSMVAGTLLAFLHPEGSSKVLPRTLTFAEHVAYQRAIEDVYWRHRIWPKENPGPKPPLDAVMSQAQLEKKVEDYLRNSQALANYWQRPITPEQLQAEMERMARDTKQPDVLGELFEALGNDPFVIAECLARPVLTERLVADVSAQDKTERFESARTNDVRSMSVAAALGNAAYTLPKISGQCTNDTWIATSIINAPSGRGGHTAVWTGSEMIVWGGSGSGDLNTGGRYNPSADNWTATSISNAPAGRYYHTAVWTGTEMIVWGGDSFWGDFSDGGRYNPSTDSWTATTNVQAPDDRFSHTAVWTGSEMIVWGGRGCDDGGGWSCYRNSDGRYYPGSDRWAPISPAAPSSRYSHTAVWTDSEMIVWGGYACAPPCGHTNTGGRYNPITDSWTITDTTNAPSGRVGHTAVWDSSDNFMVVWGGSGFNTGGRYCAATATPTATPTATATQTPTPTGTPSATPTCIRVLIAYADRGGPPNTVRSQILAEPDVAVCDLFDAANGTPTLSFLEQYNIVFAFSNNGWNDATAMGNVLAAYQDSGTGTAVVGTFAWDSRGPWNLAGRWMTGGYNPYDSTSTTYTATNTATLTMDCLLQGVNSLTAFFRYAVTLTSGAVCVATWTDGPCTVAYKVNNGHTAVGINAYLGENPMNFSGQWGKTIVNASRCFGAPPCGTPTATATATPTSTPRPSVTPRPSQSPRLRPTPAPR